MGEPRPGDPPPRAPPASPLVSPAQVASIVAACVVSAVIVGLLVQHSGPAPLLTPSAPAARASTDAAPSGEEITEETIPREPDHPVVHKVFGVDVFGGRAGLPKNADCNSPHAELGLDVWTRPYRGIVPDDPDGAVGTKEMSFRRSVCAWSEGTDYYFVYFLSDPKAPKATASQQVAKIEIVKWFTGHKEWGTTATEGFMIALETQYGTLTASPDVERPDFHFASPWVCSGNGARCTRGAVIAMRDKDVGNFELRFVNRWLLRDAAKEATAIEMGRGAAAVR